MLQPLRLFRFTQLLGCLLMLGLVTTGCTANRTPGLVSPEPPTGDQLPTLAAVTLATGEKVKVVATTNLVADVVAQIGGDHIALHPLLAPGVDPHSYTSTPQDLRSLNDAHVVFINGLHLEAGFDDLLASLAAPVVAVNIGVRTHELAAADQADHGHEGPDPHTWQRVATVKQWVENIRTTLGQLDPAHAPAYDMAAKAYQTKLDALDAEIRQKVATIPATNRKLVTDHATFGYFAEDYGFTIVGALIPSLSTVAEPSAQALAALQDQLSREGAKAIFVGTTVNPGLAEQLAQDLGIQVITLYSDSLSAPDGPAATYLDFMRYNVEAIVEALQ